MSADLQEPLSALLASLDERMRRIAEETLQRAAKSVRAASAADLIDERTRCEIAEHALLSHKTYLTRKEAAKYLGVSERSIAEWAARASTDNPFPERYAGSDPRTRRADIDAWADRESKRQRLKLAG